MRAVRGLALLLGVIKKSNAPFPSPILLEVMFIHDTSLVAVQPTSSETAAFKPLFTGMITLTLPVPPLEPNDKLSEGREISGGVVPN